MTEIAWIHWPTIGTRYTVEPDGVHTVTLGARNSAHLQAMLSGMMADRWQPFAVLKIDDCGGREIWLTRHPHKEGGDQEGNP